MTWMASVSEPWLGMVGLLQRGADQTGPHSNDSEGQLLPKLLSLFSEAEALQVLAGVDTDRLGSGIQPQPGLAVALVMQTSRRWSRCICKRILDVLHRPHE